MKMIRVLPAILMLVSVTAFAAGQKPPEQLLCADFIGAEDSIKPQMLSDTFVYGKNNKLLGDEVDETVLVKSRPALIEYCKSNSNTAFIQAVTTVLTARPLN